MTEAAVANNPDEDAAEYLAITGLWPQNGVSANTILRAADICDERSRWPWESGQIAMVSIYQSRAKWLRGAAK